MNNILRLIKLEHLYDKLQNLTPEEKLFFKLHENLHVGSSGVLYNEDNEWVVRYDIENGYFLYSYYRFYLVFKEKFVINVQHFDALCNGILEKQLYCKQLTPLMWKSHSILLL